MNSNGFLVCAAAIDRPTTPEGITIGIEVGSTTCVFATRLLPPRPTSTPLSLGSLLVDP
jgi:hypothetical protein